MIQKAIEYSVQNRFIVILAVLAIAIWGIYSLARTPVDAIPDLSENQVIVFADWMGRSPQEIEDQVTYPLSVNLQGLAGVKSVRATSEFNFSMIDVIFEDRVDFYFARQRVLERLSVAATYLPPGVTPYLAPDATALGQIFWYTVEGKGKDLAELRAIQDWYVRYQLNSVPGVAEVASVGGFVKSYEITLDPERLRAYGITLGEIAAAVGRSNSAVGGDVYVKNDAEYLVRGIGWIRDIEDIRNIVVTQRGGVPLTVGTLATVQFSPAPRRSVLEKGGREAVGGVVLMRYGENPLEVTRRVHQKIADLQAGLPAGVRIVPFYERTRLIGDAIHTLARTLREEMVIATLALLLILTHLGSAFVVVVTLPLAVLIAFILMHIFKIPSNIMSLSGIAISIGILVDGAIVMVENATHELTAQFGQERIHGDTRPIILRACKLVGRPIFLSVMIMLISFLPVFALTGQEGKMFHPLAYTKTFAMVGVALLAITLVPALLPIFLRGRLRSENENPLVRSLIDIYKPVLTFLLRHPKPFLWLFVVLLGVGWVLSHHLGREFMPPLDEGSVMDMPVTIPSVSVAKAGDDLRVRDALLRSFPEVESVVGKVGRAETPTDPAPPDMVETVVNLHPRSWWPKRMIKFENAFDEAGTLLKIMQQRAIIATPLLRDQAAPLLNAATMDAVAHMDELLRAHAMRAQEASLAEIADSLTARSVDVIVKVARRNGALTERMPAQRAALIRDLSTDLGAVLLDQPTLADAARFIQAAHDSLVARGIVNDRADPLRAPRPSLAGLTDPLLTLLGRERAGLEARVLRAIGKEREHLWMRLLKAENFALSDLAPGELVRALALALHAHAVSAAFSTRDLSEEDLTALWAARGKPLSRSLFLWRKDKNDLVQEMDSALQMPGWGNIWTQPIINRVDMLATGVRTMVGVKVYGDDLYRIQEVSEQVAGVLRGIPGAVDVFPDQIVGENYLNIEIDRERAARYGVNVGDIQEVIEVALGGRALTTTVEGRQRFPVRVRYARDFRVDPDAIGRILVSASGAGMAVGLAATGAAGGMGGSAGGSMDAGAMSAGAQPLSTASIGSPAAGENGGLPKTPLQIPLSAVATIEVTTGPSMIKSENGMLRSYVQLNVRGRDIVGFVEEAQRLVREKVKLPNGFYLEWSGQFEHQMRAKKTLQIVFPLVIALIFLILYLTFHDLPHALLMVLAVPGALVGGVIFQTLFGFNFSVAVWVGYIAAFGMATETGIVMMVYLRDALARRGGLAAIRHESEISQAVIQGAVHRLRPKLLTEGVAIIGLMPMLWAHGTGAEVMRPMVAPVLGGLLIADEVIDLLIPVLFHWVETWRWRRLQQQG